MALVIATKLSQRRLPKGYTIWTDGAVVVLCHAEGGGVTPTWGSVVALDVSDTSIAIQEHDRNAGAARFFLHDTNTQDTREFRSLQELEAAWQEAVDHPLNLEDVERYPIRDLDWFW